MWYKNYKTYKQGSNKVYIHSHFRYWFDVPTLLNVKLLFSTSSNSKASGKSSQSCMQCRSILDKDSSAHITQSRTNNFFGCQIRSRYQSMLTARTKGRWTPKSKTVNTRSRHDNAGVRSQRTFRKRYRQGTRSTSLIVAIRRNWPCFLTTCTCWPPFHIIHGMTEKWPG